MYSIDSKKTITTDEIQGCAAIEEILNYVHIGG